MQEEIKFLETQSYDDDCHLNSSLCAICRLHHLSQGKSLKGYMQGGQTSSEMDVCLRKKRVMGILENGLTKTKNMIRKQKIKKKTK